MNTKANAFACCLRGLVILLLLPFSACSGADAGDSCCDGDTAGVAPVDDRSIYQLEATFTTQDGVKVQLGHHRGHVVLIAMVFTNCSFACPALVADVKRIVEAAGAPDDLDVVLVSMDPERDRPAVLRAFATQHGLDGRYTMLHADAYTVAEVAAVLGVRYTKVEGGDYSHSNRITLLDRLGNVRDVHDGLGGSVAEFAAQVRAAATE